jgi:hypothetical protein
MLLRVTGTCRAAKGDYYTECGEELHGKRAIGKRGIDVRVTLK